MSDRIRLLHEISPQDLTAADEFVQVFGHKTFGLTRVPKEWRLPGLAIGRDLWTTYNDHGRAGVESYLSARGDTLRNVLPHWFPVLVRSSGTTETIQDRGKYLSLRIENLDGLVDACIRIFDQFREHRAPGAMALLLQPLRQARVRGHASNFRRVSKTKNQWQAEVEYSSSGDEFMLGEPLRYNSQRNQPLATEVPLRSCPGEDTLINTLRGIGSWFNKHLSDVVSIEWIDDGDYLWIVQCDDEIDAPSAIDPVALHFAATSGQTAAAQAPPFVQHSIGSSTGVRKLKVLEDFQTPNFHASHHIFHATGDTLIGPLATESGLGALAAQIDSFGPSGVVIRTEITAERADSLPNLPRTDTVAGQMAVSWLGVQLDTLTQRGFALSQVHFLMHRFIRAKGSAWSYHEPGQRVVYIDGIWGLPDGLQFYPHDTYEFDLNEQRVIRSVIRFKPYVLWPLTDGKWSALHVQAKKARTQALDLATLRWIANYTSEIATKIGAPAQVMWFCEFEQPTEYDDPLPWFRETNPTRPTALAAAPPAPSISIRTITDLRHVQDRKATGRRRLVLDPNVELIRDPQFVETLIEVCTGGSHTVVFAGSVLAHAFSQLMAAGIVVYGSGGSGRRRMIRKQEFGKLVRDKIPNNIAQRGEQVRYGVVDSKFKRALLLGKLIEELSELARAKEDTRIEELADVYEVLRGIVSDTGVSWDALVKAADEKASKRGGFSNGIVLLETSLSEDEDETEPAANPAASLIRESTSAAVNASLSIRQTNSEVSVPLYEILAGRRIDHEFVVGGRRVQIEMSLSGDRIVIVLKSVLPDIPPMTGDVL